MLSSKKLLVVICLSNSCHPTSDDSQDHLIKVFTKLMFQGNVCAAVRWITERSGGGVLKPSDLTEIFHPYGKKSSMTVFDVLRTKHREPRIPKDFAIPSFDILPCLEDAEITSAHIQSVVHQLQGGTGPGGCDSSHWHDNYFTMGYLVLGYVTLLRHCVIAFEIQLYPGMTAEHW